jgi:outer membrane protein assembly factor BamD (BamD/ComL family)
VRTVLSIVPQWSEKPVPPLRPTIPDPYRQLRALQLSEPLPDDDPPQDWEEWLLAAPLPDCIAHPTARLVTSGGLSEDKKAASSSDPNSPHAALVAAWKMYQEGKYPQAGGAFREFLQRFKMHEQAAAAEYGLALCLRETAPHDYQAQLSAWERALARPEANWRPFALYCLGAAKRGLAREAAGAAGHQPLSAEKLAAARRLWESAAADFAAAAEGFQQRLAGQPVASTATSSVQPPTSPAGSSAASPTVSLAPSPVSVDRLWLAHARLAQCEALLWQKKYPEAAALAVSLVADKALEDFSCHAAALYHLGYARFMLGDRLAAGRALSRLAPFAQKFGGHARYLLARIHHLAAEHPEAAAQYVGVVADYDRHKKTAAEALRRSHTLRPRHRAELEAFARGELPAWIARAMFHAALLALEEGRFHEASEAFATVLNNRKGSPLAEEAQLRLGYAHLRQRNFAEAIRTLQPLQNHPRLADRALWWSAQAYVGSAKASGGSPSAEAIRTARELYARAADRAVASRRDHDTQLRRADILLEQGEAEESAGLYTEAAATYQKLIAENLHPNRAQEAMERLATALQLAGQYRAAAEVCQRFEQSFPASTLLPSVWFRAAENSRLAASSSAAGNSRTAETDRLLAEAVERYRRLLRQYPDFELANLARFGQAIAHYQLRQYKEAIAALAEIDAANRVGELAVVPYLLADCHIRLLPDEVHDALQAGELIERTEQATKLLEGYVGTLDNSPAAAEPLLKLGYCQQRLGLVLIDPAERKKFFARARSTYDQLYQRAGRRGGGSGGSEAMQALAVFERARCAALAGDMGWATQELARFQTDPLRACPVAPLALLRGAQLLRLQNRPADALKLITACREQHEGALSADNARRHWVPLIRGEHALALKESGWYAES